MRRLITISKMGKSQDISFVITKILVNNNASVNKKNSEGHTALYYASQYKHKDIVKLLEAKSAESH